MRKIFSLLLMLLLVTTILSSVYDVAINDSVYAQLYSQPLEEQRPLDFFNNQPVNTFNNQPSQVELLPQQILPPQHLFFLPEYSCI